MTRIFRAGQTFLKNHRRMAGTLMALLLILLLAGAFLSAVHGSAARVPENPVKKNEAASMVRLTGTGEVLAGNFPEMDENAKGDLGETEPETESEKPWSEPEEQETQEQQTQDLQQETQSLQQESEPLQGESQTGQQPSAGNVSGGNQTEPAGSAFPGNGSGTGTGNISQEGAGGGSGEERHFGPTDTTPQSDKRKPKDDKPKPDKNVTKDGKKDREYFRTTIENGETVGKPEYSYEIEHLTECKVMRIRNALNGGKASAYKGMVNLAVGANTILVSVIYEDEDGASFKVSKEYTVYYEPGQLGIRTDLTDQTVSKGSISFQAYAQLGEEDFPLEVTVNGVAVSAFDGYFYANVPLTPGENQILLTASRDGQQASEVFTVIYEEPPETGIRIDTDLADQTVKKKKFGFYVQAFQGSVPVSDVEVLMNGTPVSPKQSGQYEVLLSEGENEFQITAAEGGVVQTAAYYVTYIKQVQGEDDGEGNEEAPTVLCTLGESGSNLTAESSVQSFTVRAQDYKGNKLGASSISFTCFGDEGDNPVSLIWENLGEVSYKVTFSPGNNTLFVYVTDEEDNTTQLTYSIFCEATTEGEPVGTAYISVEATTVGSGVLLEGDVPIYAGEPASRLLQRVLEQNGYSCEYSGTEDSGFYLARIRSSSPFVSGQIPDDLLQELHNNGIEVFPDGFDRKSLGEFDFTSQSGWMYQVNGYYPNYSFSDCYLQDGDVMRIRFTLAYGSDIGGSGAVGNGSNEGDGLDWGFEW